MQIATVRRRRWPLTTQIQHYLQVLQAPCHYTVIARRLHIKVPAKVLQACVRMAHDGRLRWCGEGMYATTT